MSFKRMWEGLTALFRRQMVVVGFTPNDHHLTTIRAAFYDTKRPVLKRKLSELHEAMGGGHLADHPNISGIVFSEEIIAGTIDASKIAFGASDVKVGQRPSPAPTEDQEHES